jgi:hypothetical protein
MSSAKGEETTREMTGKMMANIPTNITIRALNRLRMSCQIIWMLCPGRGSDGEHTCDRRDCDSDKCQCSDWLSLSSLYHVEYLSRTALYPFWEDWGCLRC